VLSEILGGPTGRLYRDLVIERGLAAAAGAWYSPDSLDMTKFGFYAVPRQGKSVEAVEAALDEAIAKLLREGVTVDEVADATKRLKASAVFARDDLETAARVLGAALATGRSIDDVEQWPARIGAVTAEQVNIAARAVLKPEGSVTGILLPKPAEAASAAPAQAPTPTPADAPAGAPQPSQPARNPS
jgi:zinc protease